MMYKKILALILGFLMIIPSLCIAQDSNSSVFEASEYGSEVGFLSDWGIIQSTGAPNEQSPTMTRGEFAVLVDRTMGYNGMHNRSEPIYSDVGTGHFAYDSIMTMYESKLMTGVGDGLFQPDAQIMLTDAIAVCVKMLNFDREAAACGGYPVGYQAVASKRGLIENVRGVKPEARRDDIYVLLYNTVHADMALYDFNHEEYRVEKGRNILTENHRIHQIEGVVEADNNTALKGDVTRDEGSIAVDGVVLQSSLKSTANVVGMNIHCYYRKTHDEYVAIAAYPENNRIITVTPAEISDFDYQNGIYTLISDEKDENIELGTRYNLVYNGEKIDGSDKSLMMPTEGTLTFIDNNEDDTYDVLLIKEYYNLVLGTYDSIKNIMYDKYSDEQVCNGRFTRNVVLDEYDEVICNTELQKISSDTVVSVYKTLSKEKLTLEVSGAAASGKLTGMYDNTEAVITINESDYRFSGDSRTDVNSLRVGENIVAHLDALGKIAYVSLNTLRNSGYILKIGFSKSDRKTFFKILTPAGISTYLSADKVKIMTDSGTKSLYSEDVEEELPIGERGFVLYETNADEKLSKIIVPKNINTYEEFSSCMGYPVYKMNYYILNWNTSGATKTYRKEITGYDNWLIFDSKAVVYTVPPENEDFDDDDVNVSLISSYPNKSKATLWTDINEVRQEKNIDVYKIGDTGSLPNVLISYEKEYTSQIVEDGAPAVVSKIQYTYDEAEAEACTIIHVAEGGKTNKLKLSDDALLTDENGIMLKKGDIIKYSLDKNSRVNMIEVHYRAEGKELITDKNANYNTIDRIYRLASGKVIKKDGSYIEIEMSYNGATKIERYNFNKLTAVICDPDEDEVTFGTTDSISVDDVVVFYSRYMNNRLAVIYKN